jgi:hypothetical protein
VNTQDPRWGQPSQGYPPQQYPPQQYSPQGQYGQPPAQYSNPSYGQPAYGYAQPQRPAVKNPYATRALIYGIVSFVLLVALFFTNYIFLGTFGIYAIYYAIKGLILTSKLPGHKGIVAATIGLVLSVLSVLGTIGVIILSATLSASH